MLRRYFVRLHRWFGLGAAGFLFVAGMTGAIISWDHELDAWLNPRMFKARGTGTPQPVTELIGRVESADPRVRVSFAPLEVEPGHTLLVSVEPRLDPGGRPFEPGYNQVALDPSTGEIQGRREWGRASLSRENLLPFLYKLHYSMHLPKKGGIELGVWLMGLIALAWTVDSFFALVISFPVAAAWARSLRFRWRQGGFPLVFDVHRSGGVWLWPLVLMLAVTSVGMNLNREVMRPVVSWFSVLSPSPLANRPLAGPRPEPRIPLAQVLDRARAEARRRGWTAPAGGVFLSTESGVWGVGFFERDRSHGEGGLGNPWLYFDARTGEAVGSDIPGTGSAGDLFLQAMFPLHSGRILGTPGRILISLMGLMVATFSATGVVLWVRRMRGRRG